MLGQMWRGGIRPGGARRRWQMTTDTPERFREVEPLSIGRWTCCAERTHGDQVYIVGGYLKPSEARALRDWLNKVLPEEKP